MAAAHVVSANATPGTATPQTVSITVSGTNPVLIVFTSSDSSNTENQYPTAVSWSLGGGQALTKVAEKVNTLDGLNARATAWVRAAPTAGAGTVSVTYNQAGSARESKVSAHVYSGTLQVLATVTPTADVVQSDTSGASQTVTPTNLTANDVTAAACSSTFENTATVTPNERYFGNESGANALSMSSGDATGTTGVTFNGAGSSWNTNHAIVALRVVASSGSAFSLVCSGDSYALTGVDTTLQQASPLTWLRVGR